MLIDCACEDDQAIEYAYSDFLIFILSYRMITGYCRSNTHEQLFVASTKYWLL